MCRTPRIIHVFLSIALLACFLSLLPTRSFAFAFNDVAERAKQLAATSYKPSPKNISKTLENLNYDQYRDIRFKRAMSPWGEKLPFELAFFHEGRVHDSPVKINEIVGKHAYELKFDPAMFDYGKNRFSPDDLAGLGFAGFRVHYPVNTPQYKDEVLAFLAASYFRALGKTQLYGLSARGLAIDTAVSTGEEFPRFVEFWIERPSATARELTIYALLDSRRATGAYRFVLKPGVETSMDVKAQLYLRENVAKLGIAPLTSMYYFGENQRPAVEDYRPEVHDSDGLSIQSSSGEWIWRPLVNPKRLLVTSFALTDPVGFGLMQRDRQFTSYQDLEAHYEARPSAWIEPKGKWGRGKVELVQIPTPNETNDNIVAYWVPDQQPKPGTPLDLEYRILWERITDKRPPLAWVAQTRRGHGFIEKPDDSIAFIVDFEGPTLAGLNIESKAEAVITTDSNAKIIHTDAYRNEVTGGWRMVVRLRRTDDKKPVELRGFLTNGNTALTETWSYILPAD